MSLPLESMYREIILDHYKNPQHRGLPADFDAEVHHVNPTCGDEVTLRVKVVDGVVEDVSYEGQGCSISQASTSVMTDLVIGQPVDAALMKHEAFLELMQSRGQLEPDEGANRETAWVGGSRGVGGTGLEPVTPSLSSWCSPN